MRKKEVDSAKKKNKRRNKETSWGERERERMNEIIN